MFWGVVCCYYSPILLHDSERSFKLNRPMTNKRKVQLLEIRIKQLEEENKILLESSSDEIKNQIKLLEKARNEYNDLIEQLYKELEEIKKFKKYFDKKEIKANLNFIQKLNRKISKI